MEKERTDMSKSPLLTMLTSTSYGMIPVLFFSESSHCGEYVNRVKIIKKYFVIFYVRIFSLKKLRVSLSLKLSGSDASPNCKVIKIFTDGAKTP